MMTFLLKLDIRRHWIQHYIRLDQCCQNVTQRISLIDTRNRWAPDDHAVQKKRV